MAGKEVPGNSVGSQMEFERQMLRAAEQMLRFERVAARLWDDGIVLKGMSVRLPKVPGGDFLVVVRADKDGSAAVCFVGSDSLMDVVRKTVATLENGTAKWKDDEYA